MLNIFRIKSVEKFRIKKRTTSDLNIQNNKCLNVQIVEFEVLKPFPVISISCFVTLCQIHLYEIKFKFMWFNMDLADSYG